MRHSWRYHLLFYYPVITPYAFLVDVLLKLLIWQDNSYEPRLGDLIFFDWDDPGGYSGPQDGVPDHVGIVEKVENGIVYTVEGNSGDRCREAHYSVGYYEIYGYGTLCL